MLRAETTYFLLFLSFTCDILGYVSRKWCKNSPFYLLRIFSGDTGATMFFEGHDGATPRHAPVQSGAGPKIEWAERERGVKKYGWAGAGRARNGSGKGAERWAGVTERGVSGERKFRPLPLRSHALLASHTRIHIARWPLNSPDLNPVDCKIWCMVYGVWQRVYQKRRRWLEMRASG